MTIFVEFVSNVKRLFRGEVPKDCLTCGGPLPSRPYYGKGVPTPFCSPGCWLLRPRSIVRAFGKGTTR